MSVDIKSFIADVPDFPKQGILFRDISPLLSAPHAFQFVVSEMAKRVQAAGVQSLVAIESRGFLFAAPIAHQVGLPLVLVRKPGKLPGERVRVEYALEYGTDVLEMKSGVVAAGSKVAVIDDVLATGGTAHATRELVHKVGAEVSAFIFLAELVGLNGRLRLGGVSAEALVQY